MRIQKKFIQNCVPNQYFHFKIHENPHTFLFEHTIWCVFGVPKTTSFNHPTKSKLFLDEFGTHFKLTRFFTARMTLRSFPRSPRRPPDLPRWGSTWSCPSAQIFVPKNGEANMFETKKTEKPYVIPWPIFDHGEKSLEGGAVGVEGTLQSQCSSRVLTKWVWSDFFPAFVLGSDTAKVVKNNAGTCWNKFRNWK